MASSTEAQRARGAADRRLREAHREEWEGYMREEYAKRDLVYRRQLTPEERAERDTQEKKRRAAQRIKAEADKAGIAVSFGDLQYDGEQGTYVVADGDASDAVELDLTTLKQKPLALEEATVEIGTRPISGASPAVPKRPIADSPQA